MSAVIRIALTATQTTDAVTELAPRVTDSTVRVPVEAGLDKGQWVRFRWTLADGAPVWEGVGRCRLCRPGRRPGSLEAILEELTFDPRNEAMFERLMHFDYGVPTDPPLRAAPGPATPMPPPPRKPLYSTRPPGPRYSTRPPGPNGASAKAAPAKLADALRDALRPKPRSFPPEIGAPDGPQTIMVDEAQWTQAKKLVRHLQLKAPALARRKWTDEKVLQEALAVGLGALEALAVKKIEE